MQRLTWVAVAGLWGMALFGWLIAPYDPYRTQLGSQIEPPGRFLLGTDTLGRDVLSRTLHGGPVTVSMAGLGAVIAWVAGGVFGASEAVSRGLLHNTLSALIQALLALPPVLIALVLVTSLGTGTGIVALAAGIAQVGLASRVWSGAIRALLSQPFIESAQAIGATRTGVLWRHLIPNALPVLTGYFCILFASSLLLSSGLTFLGVGGDPASPDWGNLLAEGRQAIRHAPWITAGPAVMLFLLTLSLNALARRFAR